MSASAFDQASTSTAQTLFIVDQGALFLTPQCLTAVAGDPRLIIDLIVSAADSELYLGTDTTNALSAAAAAIETLPWRDRGSLLQRLILVNDPAATVELAARCGVLARLFPESTAMRELPRGNGRYKDVFAHTLLVLAATPPDCITRLAALFHDVAKPQCLAVVDGQIHFPNHDQLGAQIAERRLRKLGFDAAIVAAVEVLVRLHLRANSYEGQWTESAVRRLRLDAGNQWQRLLDLSYADVTSARSETVARARRRVAQLAQRADALDAPVEISPLDGEQLMQRFGKGPGRWIGEVKARLTELVRDGRLEASDTAAAWRVAAAIVAELECRVPPLDGS